VLLLSEVTGGVEGMEVLSGLLPLGSAVSFALYNVIGRMTFGSRSALGLVAGSTRYGLIFLLPATAIELGQTSIQPPGVTDVTLLLYLGLGCSAIAFMLCGYGLAHVEAGHGAVYGNLKPVVGVTLAVGMLGEPLGVSQVAGGALVLLGIGVTLWRKVTPTSRSTRPGSGSSIRRRNAVLLPSRVTLKVMTVPAPTPPSSTVRPGIVGGRMRE
jgi:drug/metabolite transporter (DMT)-like permease